MFIQSTLEKIRALHPEALDAAVLVLRQGRSKRRAEPLVSFEWGYEVSVQIPAIRVQDLVSGEAARRRDEFEALAVEDKVRDYERRCSVAIVAKLGSSIRLQSALLLEVPAVVLEHHRRSLHEWEAEKRRVAALPVSERQQEFSKAVGHLARGKGFIALGKAR